MPNLDVICGLINTSLKAGNFKSRRFQAAKYYLIADPIKTIETDKETTSPYIIDSNGEAIELTFDDTNAFQIYHKVDTTDYKLADLDYGKPGTTMNEVANMRMIFMGSRKRMQVTLENIIAAVAVDFPKEFNQTVVGTLGANRCVIEMGSVNSDPYSVWSQEFVGVEYGLTTDSVMFSLSYKIDSDYNKACFNLCE